jgi:hypothetical protein
MRTAWCTAADLKARGPSELVEDGDVLFRQADTEFHTIMLPQCCPSETVTGLPKRRTPPSLSGECGREQDTLLASGLGCPQVCARGFREVAVAP